MAFLKAFLEVSNDMFENKHLDVGKMSQKTQGIMQYLMQFISSKESLMRNLPISYVLFLQMDVYISV